MTGRAARRTPLVMRDHRDTPSLEELGVDGWDVQLLERLVPRDRSVALLANPASRWLAGLGRGSGTDRLAAGDSARRAVVFGALAYEDESAPQFLWPAPPAGSLPADDELQRWVAAGARPARLVPYRLPMIIASHAGWIHMALDPEDLPEMLGTLEALAASWEMAVVPAPADWAWAFSR